jgi:hypothetical protein
MAFIGKAGQIIEDTGKTVTDDILGIDDSGGIIGSASNVLAQLDDTTRDILSNETVVTLTSIVLASNPATAWAVPLVQGASVAAQGGDIRDVLEASAKAYVAATNWGGSRGRCRSRRCRRRIFRNCWCRFR